MRNLIYAISLAFTLTSCLTGGFDQNPQLEELEDAIKTAPKIESLKINGAEVQRNTQTRRVVEAAMGDVLKFDVMISGGTAELDELEFSHIFYYGDPDYESDPVLVDADATEPMKISGKTYNFLYDYTVPELDLDGDPMHPGDVIQVFVRAKNTIDNYGYRAIEVHITE